MSHIEKISEIIKLKCKFLGHKGNLLVFLDDKHFTLIYFDKKDFVSEMFKSPVGSDCQSDIKYYFEGRSEFFNVTIAEKGLGKYDLNVEFPSGRYVSSEFDLLPKIKEMINSDPDYKDSMEF